MIAPLGSYKVQLENTRDNIQLTTYHCLTIQNIYSYGLMVIHFVYFMLLYPLENTTFYQVLIIGSLQHNSRQMFVWPMKLSRIIDTLVFMKWLLCLWYRVYILLISGAGTAGSSGASGASCGSRGGHGQASDVLANVAYGSIYSAGTSGSGGGSGTSAGSGGKGGGHLHAVVLGVVTVNGQIRANGQGAQVSFWKKSS